MKSEIVIKILGDALENCISAIMKAEKKGKADNQLLAAKRDALVSMEAALEYVRGNK